MVALRVLGVTHVAGADALEGRMQTPVVIRWYGVVQRAVENPDGHVLQAPGHAVHAVIGLERHLAALQGLELVHPLGIARRGLGGLVVGHAKAFQVDQAANAPGPCTGVEHDDAAPHAVAHQVDRGVASVVVEQLVEVGQVVWKKIMVGR